MYRSATKSLWATGALAGFVAVAAFGCGSSGPDVSAGRTQPRQESEPAPTTQTVRYGDVEFTVPGDWPVYDLDADPSICVRFDTSAVYLGHPGANMQCPANVFGRADAVLVEPLEGATRLPVIPSVSEVNGLAVATDTGAATENEVRASIPDAGVSITISFDEDGGADEILQSFRPAAQ
jgi:hypothetical protein